MRKIPAMLIKTACSCVTAVAILQMGYLSSAHAQVGESSSSASDAAAAVEAEGLKLEEVLVTATRQSQTAQTVPFALTAVSGDQLVKEGVTSSMQLSQLAPSLYVLGSVSEGSPRFTIRGLTGTDTVPAGSPAVATYIDDVFQASQFGIGKGLFDIDRIEILRGPQGTTFGKNTTGGAVAYFSKAPSNDFEAYATVRGAGGYRSEEFLEAALNLPILDHKLAMRFSARVDNHGDYAHDQLTGAGRGANHSESERFQLRWTPTDDTMANLTLFDSRLRGDSPLSYAEFLPNTLIDPKSVASSPYRWYDNFDNSGATLRIEQGLGLFNLTSISHYRRTQADSSQDLDGTYADTFFYANSALSRQFGQEFRLASDPKRRLSSVLGLYFEKDDVSEQSSSAETLNPPGQNFNDYFLQDTRTATYAAFASSTLRFADQLSLIAGLRKSIERKTFDVTKYYFMTTTYQWTQSNLFYNGNPPLVPDQLLAYTLHEDAKPLTWDVTLDYTPTESLLLFARSAKGYRSGGFNDTFTAFSVYQLPLGIPPPFQGETVKSYEAGVKSSFGVLRVNATVYHYDYTNQQVTVYYNGLMQTANAASSVTDGAELEVVALPVRHLEVRNSMSYTDARYKDYTDPFLQVNYKGKSLQQAPRWIANTSISYFTPVSADYLVRGTMSWSYRSRIFFDSSNDPNLSAASLTSGSLRLGLETASGQGMSVAAFVNNVTNQTPLASGFNFGTGYYVKYFDLGRLYGLDLTYRW